MAAELVRIKVENKTGQAISGALLRIFDEDGKVLKAQGLTSEGPDPAEGIFETVLSGSLQPGTLYIVHYSGDQLDFNSGRSQIRVLS